ncbi:acyltransferase family protein [Puniceibacterium confluentis]|uniref:acyltransferase family protein n=1 Tax=Puniceibacterium confluentis TaxID=1958944 RepID=UPI001644FCD2|nr:acyltransferase [Puniceibacterium confluentis]
MYYDASRFLIRSFAESGPPAYPWPRRVAWVRNSHGAHRARLLSGAGTGSPPLVDEIFQFGWAGVDLFFVLSGFLITSILLEAKGSANAFRNFYVKRVGRIFPLYYAIFFIFLLASAVSLHPKFDPLMDDVAQYWYLYGFFASNLFEIFGIDNYNPAFAVTWSLAVEEQFYLVWPFLVLMLQRKTLSVILPALFVAQLVLRATLIGQVDHDLIYHFTLTHGDGLIFGSMLALRGDYLWRHRRLLPWLLLGSAVLLVLVFIVSGGTSYQLPSVQLFGYPLIALTCTLLLTLSMDKGLVARIMQMSLLRTFGKYSFFIYLTHQPVLFAGDQLPLPGGLISWSLYFIGFCAVMIGLGTLSWRYFETPAAKFVRSRFLGPKTHAKAAEA